MSPYVIRMYCTVYTLTLTLCSFDTVRFRDIIIEHKRYKKHKSLFLTLNRSALYYTIIS